MRILRSKLVHDVYLAVRILALAGILAYLAQRMHIERAALAGIDFEWSISAFVGALVCAVAAYQLLFLAWLVLLERAGLYRKGSVGAYAYVWWHSYIYRYVPGKLMLAIERARLGKRLGVPYATGAALPVIETLLSILAGGVVSLLAVSSYAPGAGDILAVLAVAVGGTTLLLPVFFRWAVQSQPLKRRYPQLESVRLRASDVLFAVVPYVFHYLLLGVSFFLLVRMAYPLAWSELPGLCGIYALSHVIGLLVVVAPGGLGVREGALAIQLNKLLPAGLAGAVAIAARLWFTLVELVCWSFVICSCRSHRGLEAERRMP